MAPGGNLTKKKARFAPNHTSINSTPRMIHRVQSDGGNGTPSQASSHPTQSTGSQIQPTSPQTPTTGHQKITSSPPFKSVKYKQQPSATPTLSSGLQADATRHLRDEPSDNIQDASHDETDKTVEENTTGSSPMKKKARFASNRKPSESSPNESDTPKNAPSNRQAQSISRQIQSTGRQIQTTSRQNQSSGQKTKSTNPQTKSAVPQEHSISPQTQPALNKQSSAPPTESNVMQTDGIGHSYDDSTDNTHDASQDNTDETVAVASTEKRKRGPTMGRGLMKTIGGSSGKKLKIDVDTAIGRPKNRVQSAKLSSEVGVVARDVLPIPRKWKDVDVKTALEPCFDHIQIHMEVNLDKPGVKQCLIDRLKNSSRQQRYRLHAHFKRFANVQEAKRNKPTSVNDQEQWELLCDHFDSAKFKNQSRANTNNRKQMQAKHITGRTPFTIIQNEVSRKNGKECDMIELYKLTHQSANGKWSSAVAEENWELMKESVIKYAAEGIEITEQQIVAEVLGSANGYIKGLGYGPKPPGKRNTQIQQELDETQAELKEAKIENAAYKTKVDAMNVQLNEQASQIAKLMAFMEGRSGLDEDDDSD